MNLITRIALIAALSGGSAAEAQKLKKADKMVISNLQRHVNFLADDRLEGRRAGTAGEELAREYIAAEFGKVGLLPKGDNGGWWQAFPIYDGKDYSKDSYLFIDEHEVDRKSFFPHPQSPEKIVEAMPSIAIREAGVPWFLDLAEEKTANEGNPHFDMEANIIARAKDAAEKGATALLVTNDGSVEYQAKKKGETLPIPVVYISRTVAEKYFADETAVIEIKLRTAFNQLERTGNNVVGYLDNGAPYTVILGAHYDHLGYGEDGNSMLRNNERHIHNGADDNASGTAALIELARRLKAEKKPVANYLFIAFSAEELGLFGSKYFTEHATIPMNSVSYMINMDMVGRLNESKSLTIGGVGTSPQWAKTFSSVSDARYFNIKFDSSGTGPSDHSSFYRKDIPVLFFFTGLHTDYHKPGDDAAAINYEGQYRILRLVEGVVKQTPADNKLVFTKTREQQTTTSARFSVSLGIMPDYSFSGNGVKVDGVTDGRAASKAGILTGDVIVQLGEHTTASVEAYMQALSRFKKGDSTQVKFRRGDKEQTAPIVF